MGKVSKEAKARYQAKAYKQMKIDLHVVNDADVIMRLEHVPSKRKYILQLIRDDIEKDG